MNKQLIIPKPFQCPPFFKSNEFFLISDTFHVFAEPLKICPFYDDMIYSLEVNHRLILPWQHREKALEWILIKWKTEGLPKLRRYLQERDRNQAQFYMIKYTSYYIQLMHWIDEEPVNSLIKVGLYLQEKKFSPVNLADRLTFICRSIDHHHALSILKQLYEESEKKWAIHLAQN